MCTWEWYGITLILSLSIYIIYKRSSENEVDGKWWNGGCLGHRKWQHLHIDIRTSNTSGIISIICEHAKRQSVECIK